MQLLASSDCLLPDPLLREPHPRQSGPVFSTPAINRGHNCLQISFIYRERLVGLSRDLDDLAVSLLSSVREEDLAYSMLSQPITSFNSRSLAELAIQVVRLSLLHFVQCETRKFMVHKHMQYWFNRRFYGQPSSIRLILSSLIESTSLILPFRCWTHKSSIDYGGAERRRRPRSDYSEER